MVTVVTCGLGAHKLSWEAFMVIAVRARIIKMYEFHESITMVITGRAIALKSYYTHHVLTEFEQSFVLQ